MIFFDNVFVLWLEFLILLIFFVLNLNIFFDIILIKGVLNDENDILSVWLKVYIMVWCVGGIILVKIGELMVGLY